jgi:hypothetical protein
MRRFFLAALLLLLPALTTPARGIPVFARAYHLPCQSCHNGFPRLNAFGLNFKANAFRIPGAEKKAVLAWQKTIPLAVQILPTYESSNPKPDVVQYTDTQLLAAGLLTRTTAFYLHQSLWTDFNPVPFPSDEVWGQQVLDERSKLMFKFGQFELPFAYSPHIHLVTVIPPYIFGAGLHGNDVLLGSDVRGLQLSGTIARQARWYVVGSAPATNTSGYANDALQFFGAYRDLFIRITNYDLARNVGFFMYFTSPPRDPADSSTEDHGQRYGIDANYYWRNLELFAMAVIGGNDDPTGKGQHGYLHGGFIEANYMIKPWIGLTARLETQMTEVAAARRTTDAMTFSLRLYPFQKLRLTAEYQQRNHGDGTTALQASLSF